MSFDFKKRYKAFTLSELMIVIVVTSFVMILLVPKIGQTDKAKRNAVVRETASTVANAYRTLATKNGSFATTSFTDVMSYIQGARLVTTNELDTFNLTAGPIECDSGYTCYALRNGAVIAAATGGNSIFGGETNLHAIKMIVDSDGEYRPNNVKSKSIALVLSFDGHMTDLSNLRPGTIINSTLHSSCPSATCTPVWFEW